jgi:hypothetical protein
MTVRAACDGLKACSDVLTSTNVECRLICDGREIILPAALSGVIILNINSCT